MMQRAMIYVGRNLLRRLKVNQRLTLLEKQLSTSSARSALCLKGVFPPISTPFSADGEERLDFEKLEANLKTYNESPLAGL